MSLEQLRKSLVREFAKETKDVATFGVILTQIKETLLSNDAANYFPIPILSKTQREVERVISAVDRTLVGLDVNDALTVNCHLLVLLVTRKDAGRNLKLAKLKTLSELISSSAFSKTLLSKLILENDNFLPSIIAGSPLFSRSVIRVLSRLLDPTDFEHLPGNYALVVKALESRLTLILDDTKDARRQEVEFVTLLSSLQNITQAKNSLVVMSGLSPPIFDLIFERLHLKDPALIQLSPLVHFAILSLAKNFVGVHEYFYSSSELAQPAEYSFVTETRSAKCFGIILQTTIALVREASKLQKDVLFEFLNFVLGIAEAAGECLTKNVSLIHDLKLELIFMAFVIADKPYSTRRIFENISKKFGLIEALPKITKSELSEFWKEFLFKFNNLSESSQRNFCYVFPLSCFLHCNLNGPAIGLFDKIQPVMVRSDLHQREFLMLMSFLLNQEGPPSVLKTEGVCKPVDFFVKGAEDGWIKLLNRLALCCIENRMKTTFGKPLETFTAFDNGIKAILNGNVDHLQYLLFPESENIESEAGDNKRKKLLPSEEFLRVNCLLTFVDALEKLMVFAERGSIVDYAKPSDAARQFFVNNAASCQGWIARITPTMLQICYRAGRYAQVVRFGATFCAIQKQRKERLKSVIKFDENSQMILGYMVKALIELNAASAIAGVRVFGKQVFGTDLDFTWPAEFLATGKFELALDQINLFLPIEGLDKFTKEFLMEMQISIYKKLRNPSVFGKYDKSSNGVSGKRLSALLNWDIVSEDCVSLPWEVDRRLEDFELRFMEIYLAMQNHGRNSVLKKPLEEQIKQVSLEMSRYAFVLNSVDVTPRVRAQFAVLHSIKRAVSLKLSDSGFKNGSFKKDGEYFSDYEKILSENWKLDTTDRLAIAVQFNTWLMKLSPPGSDALVRSQELLVALARKTGNGQMANYHLRQLEKLLDDQRNRKPPTNNFVNGLVSTPNPFVYSPPMQTFGIPVMGPNGLTYIPVAPTAIQMTPNLPTPNSDLVIQSAKISKLFQKKPDDSSAFFALSNVVSQDVMLCSPSISPAPGMMSNDDEFIKKIAKIKKVCLKLGNWTKDFSNTSNGIFEMNNYPRNMFWDMVMKRFNLLSGYCGEVPKEKTLSGALYWLSTEIGNNLIGREIEYAKAHRKMAEWALEQLYEPDETLVKLTESELTRLAEMGLDPKHSKFKEFRKLLTTADNLQVFKKQAAIIMKTGDSSIFDTLSFVNFFNMLKQRQTALFDIALSGYLQFLAQLGKFNIESSIHSVAATLHVLQMLVSRPDLFEKSTNGYWLTNVNERIFKDIIPQLFARLNHPNVKVREAICQLLKNIGQSSPHAICFPAIVGAYFSRPIQMTTEAETEGHGENYDTDMDEAMGITNEFRQDRSLMSAACLTLVGSLQEKYPKLVEDVTAFVKELQRINMLYEEKWAFVLNNLDIEMTKRFRQIETENQAIMTAKHLTEEEKIKMNKQRAELLTEIIRQILEDLYNSTCIPSEMLSVNEAQFQQNFEREIAEAFVHFEAYRITDPKFSWELFKKLGATLNQRASKKSSLSLLTSEMSPYLSSMENTAIPIPGQELNEGKIVTIAKMKENVSVMLTKTRPKKITFIGSDGKEYVFLFKGQEDLHLDERVMQLLHICNLMLSNKKSIEPNDAWPAYYSRNYSVTPLGIRSGLIRWVDGATPMFQIYRKWKTRQIAMERKGNDGDGNQPDPERPMDMFVKQLQSVFTANNVPNDVRFDRKRWPVSVLRQVLEKLIEVTPRDILSKELWMMAGSSESWWRVTQRFARSTAVASMVGSVIGLGDRHMENLLINLSTGDVIHIDYNICFDKGRQLRVPETVPFRLTGNIIYALGPTQIEGTFRQSCEHVMSVLRNGKETLLAMLDAFVYDPLVDWAMQDQVVSAAVNVGTILAVYGTEDRTMAAKQLTLSLFQLRLKECNVPWLDAAKTLEEVLKKAIYLLAKFVPENDIKIKPNPQLIDMTKKLHKAMKDHYVIASRFRPLVKTLAHFDDRFAMYSRRYSELLSDPLARGFKLLNEEDIDLQKCSEYFNFAVQHIDEVHNGLLQLEKVTDLRITGNGLTTDLEKMIIGEEVVKLPQEDENMHAKLISKRIRRRLEGREHLQNMSDSSTLSEVAKIAKRHTIDAPMCAEGPEMTPAQQVEMLISCAMNSNNLAFMYEGWTAWLNEIVLPTGDDDFQGVLDDSDDTLDLSRLSDEELWALERALQNKIEEYEAQQGYVEDSIPIVRDRRAGGRHIEDPAVDLVPMIDDEETSPILFLEAPIEEQEEKQFLLVPEPEDGEDARPILLSAAELDELELRERINELGDILKERALRGVM